MIPILMITNHKTPHSGYARGVVVEINGKVIELPLSTNHTKEALEYIWENRESYVGGEVDIYIISDKLGIAEFVSPNPNYVKPVDTRIDLRDVRKVFEEIQIIL